ncbi:MAG: ASKHA domain-containing protein, partial [Chloroflexota bacterium]
LWHDQVIDVKPGYQEGIYGLAVDIGSTTVAGYLCDLRTGDVLATESVMNPQVTYGEDLMSRVSYAMSHSDGLDKMHKAIIDTLNRLAAGAARSAGLQARDIQELVVAGNTTMIHIFLGIDPIELGGAPFALANRDSMDVKARELGLRLHRGANVHVLPAEAGHVGADNVGVLLAEEPYNQDEIVLTVDVGTNAEIVLGNRDWMYSASSPTGPAFEGAQITFGMRAAPGAIERVRIDPDTHEARFRVIGDERWSDEWRIGSDAPPEAQPKHLAAGICGSGIIEVVAQMFLAGIIRADGRFEPTLEGPRIRWDGRAGSYILATAQQSATGKPIVVTQDDVRNVQLAKAALYAGARLLMMRADVDKVDRVVLAGAFGSYIDPQHAMVLGLIPDCDLQRVYAVGNAAGDGARIALLNRDKRREAQRIAHWVRYIETAVDADFQEAFVAAIHLPHAEDAFPHLEDILPENRTVERKPRNERRRKRRGQLEIGD